MLTQTTRTTADIRTAFSQKLFSTDDTHLLDDIELIGVSFIANEDTIFGAPNDEYIQRELQWYDSMSLSVDDIPGDTPFIWREVSDKNGLINSNYGFLVYSEENGAQYDNVLAKLLSHKNSRQAVAVYTRPSIHGEWNTDGRKDFICTNAVQYLIRDGRLHTVVQMRSNDAIFGYRNDFAWQDTVRRRLLSDLRLDGYPSLELGEMIWQVGSLHIYPRHFHLIKQFAQTGNYRDEL